MTLRSPLKLLFVSLLLAAGMQAQMTMYASMSVNESTHQISLYAATTLDYGSYYYYDTWVYMDLRVDSGPQVCAVQQSGAGDSSVSCTYTVSPGSHTLDLDTWHNLNASYSYYQLTGCYWCYGQGDQYGYSLLASGVGYPGTTTITPPWVLTQSQGTTVFQDRTYQRKFAGCVPPTTETSTFQTWGSGSQSYVAGFRGNLSGGAFDYKNVREQVYFSYPSTSLTPYPHSDGCHYSGSPYMPIFPDYMGAWTVGSVNVFGAPFPLSNSYGVDGIGFTNTSAPFLHYKSRMQSTGQSCTVRWVQQMEYACSAYADWRWYKNNAIDITIGSTSLSVWRDGTSATFRPY